MRIKLHKRLSFRQALYTFFIAIILGFVFSSIQISIDLLQEQQQIENTVSQVVGIIEETAGLAIHNLENDHVERIVNGLFEYQPIYSVKVTGDFDITIVDVKHNRSRSPFEEVISLVFDSEKPLLYDIQFKSLIEPVGRFEIRVDGNLIARNFIDRALVTYGIGLLQNISLAFVLILVFYYFLTQPLLNLIQHISLLDSTNPAANLLKYQKRHQQDELGLLIQTINKLLVDFDSSLENHQKAEIRAQQSEERFRSLVETSKNWIWEVDTEGKYTYVSPKIKKLLGYEAEEVLGKSVEMFRVSSNKPKLIKEYEAILSSEVGVHNKVMKNLKKDGTQVIIECNAEPFFNSSGKLAGYRGMDRDITEKKHAEEEINKMREYSQNIIDSMPSLVIGLDLNCTITHWNIAAEEKTGINEKIAKGKHISIVLPELGPHIKMIQLAMSEQTPKKAEKIQSGKINEIKYSDIMIYPLTTGNINGAVVRIDDVTARVKMEEIMIQTEKMMSVGGLAAGMAHEINNPLGGIMQGAQNIIRRLSPELEINHKIAAESNIDLKNLETYLEKRKILTFLEGIRESGLRASTIVSNMLKFSRRSESSLAPLNICSLIDKAVDLARSDYDLKKRFDFRHVNIIRQYEDSSTKIDCTETEIEQVMLNLLKNAAHSLMEAKQSEPVIVLRTLLEGRYIRIEVEDNGMGITNGTKSRVFEPFFTTKPVNEGTGLGLSVSYMIITNNHKGIMEVESKPKNWARFIIKIPLKYIPGAIEHNESP